MSLTWSLRLSPTQMKSWRKCIYRYCNLVNQRLLTIITIPCQENGWDLLNSYFATKCEKLEAEKAAEAARE